MGAFAVIVSTDPSGEGLDAPAPPRPPAQVALPAREPDARPRVLILDPALDDQALARELEQAHFDRDWGRAAAVEHVLRARGARGQGGAPPAPTAAAAPSLVRLDHEYRRATFERELQVRQNAATLVARQAGQADDGDAERRLVALLQAPLVRVEDEQVRADAAHLLARLKTPEARRALQAALEGPDPVLSQLGAQALARAADPLATDALLGLLQSDRDPTLRARAADALVDAADLIQPASPVPAALARVALDDRDPAVRTHAIATLARADLAAQPSSRAALARLVTDDAEDAVVRQAAVAALRTQHAIARALPSDLVDALLAALDRTSGPLRLDVIAALGEAALAPALPRLEASALAATEPREAQALHEAALAVRARSPD